MQDNNTGVKTEKTYFVIKLIPPRPTFAQDTTKEEMDIMKQHGVYWKDKTDKGIAIIYGPVQDPNGVYGLGIIEVENEDQARIFAADDPAVKSGLSRIEIHPMRAILRK
jgi:uncharacterized protein YciI